MKDKHTPKNRPQSPHITKARTVLYTLALLLTISLSFSSCSPWDGEKGEIYRAAQKGDRLARFAIIEEYKSFKGIVHEDTIETYVWQFIEEGNSRALQLKRYHEWDKFRENNPQRAQDNYNEVRDSIDAIWYRIGIEYNDYKSCQYLADDYKQKFDSTGNREDSIKAATLYMMSIERGNENLRIRRDREAGYNALIQGGLEWGDYVHKYKLSEKTAITRFFLSCSYSCNYIISGVINQLFTADWWKVLLILITMLIILTIPIILVFLPLPLANYIKSKTKEDKKEVLKDLKESLSTPFGGIFFGFWNYMCYAVAVTNDNIVWENNVTSLFLADSGYGIQQYLPIVMNWLALIYICNEIYTTYSRSRKKKDKITDTALKITISFLTFLVSYVMAQVGGILIVILLIIIIFVRGAIVSITQGKKEEKIRLHKIH